MLFSTSALPDGEGVLADLSGTGRTQLPLILQVGLETLIEHDHAPSQR